MEKEKSITRKQNRKPAIIDADIPECWNLQDMMVFPKNELRWMKFWQQKAIDVRYMIAKSNLGINYLFGNPIDLGLEPKPIRLKQENLLKLP